MRFPKPSKENSYLSDHIRLLRQNLQKFTGKDLVPPGLNDEAAAEEIYFAPFAVVSHDASQDPVFNYANQTALTLFEMTWEAFTALPSRKSAESLEREERARLLQEVSVKGFMDDYSGIRISRTGKRFFIRNATVWNLTDPNGLVYGQAATFRDWKFI